MWKYISDIIIKNRLIIICVLFGYIFFMGYQAQQVKLSYSIAQLVPKDHQISIDYNNFLKKYGEQNIFVIAIKDLTSNEEKILSRGPKDDSPSFAPNGNWLIFSSTIRGREILSAVSVDGKVKTRLSLESGNIRSPAWGNIP